MLVVFSRRPHTAASDFSIVINEVYKGCLEKNNQRPVSFFSVYSVEDMISEERVANIFSNLFVFQFHIFSGSFFLHAFFFLIINI